MKLIYFTYDFPYPLTSGGKNRAYHMLKYGTKGIEVILFSFYREVPDNNAIEAIERLGIDKIRLFKRKNANFRSQASDPIAFLRALPSNVSLMNPKTSITKKLYFQKSVLDELIKTITEEKVDAVHFESLYTAYYYSEAIRKLGVTQIFGTENIEYHVYRDYALHATKRLMAPFYMFEAQKIKRDEEYLLKSVDACMAVSRDDAEVVTSITSKPCEVFENGVDVTTFSFKKKSKQSRTLLFVGNFAYFPNVEAITDFYRDVFSKVKEECTLTIIGKNANNLSISDPRVDKIEYVDDIRESYWDADVFVFPVKIGGGTNFKLVEAMACGTPIVAYPSRVQGLGVQNGKELLIAKDSDSFVHIISEILSGKQKTDDIARHARTFVEKNYSWNVIGEKLNTFWKAHK